MRARMLTIICLLLAGALIAPHPAVATATGMRASVWLTPSDVSVVIEDLGSVDHVEVRAGARTTDVRRATNTSFICISAFRSTVRSEVRNGDEVEVSTQQWERGCAEDADYRFDGTMWRADAAAEIPTAVRTTLWERGPEGRELLEEREERATSTVDLSWRGVGDERSHAWAYPPRICYTYPPSLCGYGAGAAISRDGIVDGDVRLGGLSSLLSVPTDHLGAMRWGTGV